MRPFKFIRYFLLNTGEFAEYYRSHPDIQGLKDFLVGFQDRYKAYTFIYGDSVFALFDTNTESPSINTDQVGVRYSETTYLGQRFRKHKLKINSNNQHRPDTKYFIEGFSKYGHLMAKFQAMASALNTDHYQFFVQYLIRDNQAIMILACEDLIVDNTPMFQGDPSLLELPSTLLGDILQDPRKIDCVHKHITGTHPEYEPPNDWTLLSTIDSLRESLENNKSQPAYLRVEQENKIATLVEICRRLGLPSNR